MYLRIAIASVVMSVFAACEQCPSCPQIPLESGTYETTGASGPGLGTPAGTFPWGPEVKTMDVDMSQRVVRLRYTRDGHQIEETWRMASVSQCPP